MMALIIGLLSMTLTIPSYAGIKSAIKKSAKKAKSTAGKGVDKAKDTAPKVKNTANKAVDKGKDTVHQADRQAKPVADNVSDVFKNIVK